jgi:uncharacterized membrane protein YcaP (DUF421 family)
VLWEGTLVAAWRTVVGFVLALTVTRLLNKQFVAQLTYFDFTLGVVIGALVGHIPNDYRDPFWPVAIPLVVVTLLGLGIGWVAMRYEKVRHLLQGEPTVLIQNGKLMEQNMRRLRYNIDQLNSQLRSNSVWEIEQVEFAVLEPGGRLSVLPKSQYRPVMPSDLKLPTQYEGMPIELIMDGTVIHKNLRENGLSEAWLHDRLDERGIDDVTAVFYAVLSTQGHVTVDLYSDRLTRPVDIEGKHPSTPPSPSLT